MVNDILKNRKQKRYKILKTVLVVGLLVIGIISYGVYSLFFDMNRLPKGEYLTEETSPDGTYTLKAYISIGGATTSDAIQGELVFNK